MAGSPPQKLLRLTPTGQEIGSWQLPLCIDGSHLYADPTGRYVLVETNIGYGCSGGGTIRIAQVHGKQLGLIASYPEPTNAELYAAGW
jgi:hypothetical protein